VLVSHSEAFIGQMATRVLWLDGGRVKRYGETDEVLEEYLEASYDRLDKHQRAIRTGRVKTDPVKTQDITITRVFDAPRELVWSAWTEREQLAKWWGMRGWTAPPETITMDVRPGGAFRVTIVNDEDGREVPLRGAVYREVVEAERLVLEETAGDGQLEGGVSVATFTDLGDGRTQMGLHVTIQRTDEMRDAAEADLASLLDRLAEQLA